MGRRKETTGDKPKKRKKVTVRLIKERHAGETTEPYALLAEIRKKDHGHLADAQIALAWRLGWRADANNILTLGKCRKRGDLDRELDHFDFVILLNKEAWASLNETHKRALIDHELCHAQIVMDSDGEPKHDDCDRLVCRLRKHDVEEFKSIVKRHGLYTQDLAAIAVAAVNDSKRPLLAVTEGNGQAASGNGESEKPSKAWRRWKVTTLGDCGLPPGKLKLLEEAGIDTLGKLCDRMNRQGSEDFWWKDIKGYGESGYDATVNAIMALRSARPEFQADEALATATS